MSARWQRIQHLLQPDDLLWLEPRESHLLGRGAGRCRQPELCCQFHLECQPDGAAHTGDYLDAGQPDATRPAPASASPTQQAGVSFLCQLDGSAFSNCSSPKTYSGLSQGTHTFSVKAQDAAGNQSGAASFTWTIDTTAPPRPVITSSPTKPTNQTSASFSFTDTEAGVSFLCQLDSSHIQCLLEPDDLLRVPEPR